MTPPAPISAQCPDCRLHALVPVPLEVDRRGRWRQRRRGDAPAAAWIHSCPICGGAWFDQRAGDDDLPAPSGGDATSRRGCPRGHGATERRLLPLMDAAIDRCPVCRGLWIAGVERRAILRGASRAERLALVGGGLLWVAQILTSLPVELDDPRRGRPWALLGVSGILIACYVASVLGLVYAIHFAIRGEGLLRDPEAAAPSLLGYLLFHADGSHLLFNLYFLLLFGHALEPLFGRVRLLALFVAAGLAGGAAQALLAPPTSPPLIGASAAIAGVMGAHLWIFPRARVMQVLPVVPIQIVLPAWVYLGLWFACQVVMAMTATTAGVAWRSHVVGFVVGVAITAWVASRRRQEVAAAVQHPAPARSAGSTA